MKEMESDVRSDNAIGKFKSKKVFDLDLAAGLRSWQKPSG